MILNYKQQLSYMHLATVTCHDALCNTIPHTPNVFSQGFQISGSLAMPATVEKITEHHFLTIHLAPSTFSSYRQFCMQGLK